MAKCSPCSNSAESYIAYQPQCCVKDETPLSPVKLEIADTTERTITPTTQTIDSNKWTASRKGACSTTSLIGSEGSLPFEFCDGLNQGLIDAAFASRPFDAPTTELQQIDVVDVDTYQADPTATYDFCDLGYCEGMVIDVDGFTNVANNGRKIICEVICTEYDVDGVTVLTPSQIKVLTDNGVDCTETTIDTDFPELIIETGAPTTQSITSGVTLLKPGSEVQPLFVEFGKPETGDFERYSGVLISSFEINGDIDGRVTGNFNLIGSGEPDLTATESVGTLLEGVDCCGWTTNNTKLYVGCREVCWTSFGFTIENNVNQTRTSCGTCLGLGQVDLSGTVTLTDKDRDFLGSFGGGTIPFTFEIFNDDYSKKLVISLPAVSVSAYDPARTREGADLFTYEFQAEAGACGECVYLQRFFDVDPVIRNRIDLVTCGASLDTDITYAGAEETVYDYGDGTGQTVTAATTNDAQSYTYLAPNDVGCKRVSIYTEGDNPITDIVITGQSVKCLEICSVFTQFVETIDLTNNDLSDLDLINKPALTTVDVSGNAELSNVDLTGSCAITSFTAVGVDLNQVQIDKLLKHFDECGQTGGIIDLTGGTSDTPGATGISFIASLVAKGWTVNVN